MSRSDEDPPEPSDDPDRAAILARRRRFIALALSGLAGAAACDRDGRSTGHPQPCLKVAAPERPPSTPPTDTPPTDTPPTDTPPPEPPPQPCLEVATPQPCLSPPQACLKVANPQPCLSPPTTTPTPCLDVGPPQPPQPPETKPPPKPRRKAAPRACLDIDISPQVCLMIAEIVRDDDLDDDE